MKRRRNKLMAMLLSACLVLSGIPSSVFAEPAVSVDESCQETELIDADAEYNEDVEISESAEPEDAEDVQEEIVSEEAPEEELLGEGVTADSFWASLNELADVTNDSVYPFAVTEDETALVSTNKGVNNARAYITFTAKESFALGFKYKISSEASYDYMSVILNGTDLHSSKKREYSGSITDYKQYIIRLAANDVLKIGYYKDSSGNNGDDSLWLRDICMIPVVTFTGAPASAEWTIVDNDANEYTVTDGACALLPGEYTYHAEAFGYQDADGTFTVGEESMSVAVDMPQNATYHVTFNLTGMVDGRTPTITVKHGNDVLEASENGTYFLVPESYTYTIAGTGYKTVTGDFTVGTEDQTIDLALERVPTVEEYLDNVLAFATLNNSGTYPFIIPDSGDKLISGNKGKSGSISRFELTFTSPAIVSFDYSVSSEQNYDKLKVTLNGRTVKEDSGVNSGNISLNLVPGDVLVIAYNKDSGGDRNDDQVVVSNFFAAALHTITFKDAPEGASIVMKDDRDNNVTVANSAAIVPEGTYSYEISAFGYETKTGSAVVADSDVEVDASLTALQGKKLTFTISGLAEDVVPQITVNREGTSYEAAEDGSYNLIPSSYSYKIKAEGYKTVKGTVEITDEDVNLEIAMVEGVQWSGDVADGFDGGSGTAEDPYQIRTAEQLAYLSAQVQAGEKYAGAYLLLTADIDMGDEIAFTPIGTTSALCFKGNFDGNGHSVNNLYVNTTANYAGLFGYVDAAVISNLTVDGSISGKQYVAGIAGYANGASVFENCTNRAEVKASGTNVGGIVGRSNGNSTASVSINGCINNGTIDIGANNFAGGIAGYAQYTNITNSYNTGSVRSNRGGGIVGQEGINCSFRNLYSIGSVTLAAEGDYNYVGALAGYINNAYSWDNCYCLNDIPYAGNSSDVPGMIPKTAEQMKSAGVIADLGGSFIADTNNINNGFPVLGRQDPSALFLVYFEVEGAGIIVKDSEGQVVEAGEIANNYNLPSGTYSYTVTKEEYETVEGTFTINGSGLKITPEMVIRTYEFELTVEPEDVPVIVTDSKGTETTLTGGTNRLPKGNYTYTAQKFGYESTSGSFAITDGIESMQITLQEAEKYNFTFEVKDAESEETLTEAVITIIHEEGGVQTAGADGVYALPNGQYSYTVTCPEHIRFNGQLTVNNEGANVVVTLEEGSNVWTGEIAENAPAVETIDGEEYYLITSAEELAWAQNQVNTVGNTAINLKLMTNLVLNSDEAPTANAWPGIGAYDKQFIGKIDGNGKTISGLYSESTGLLGYGGSGSLVKNLTVEGIITEGAVTGGFANQSYGSFENCTNRVNISANYSAAVVVGGIVGRAYATCEISGCANEGNISVTKSGSYSDVKVGGIAGDLYGTADQCSNRGNITITANGYVYAGGIIGSSNGSSSTPGARLTNCYNLGAISSNNGKSNYLGGISGRHTVGSAPVIANCYNAGSISSTGSSRNVGAIAGDINNNVENCYYLNSSSAEAIGTVRDSFTVEADAMDDAAMRQPELVIALGTSVWGVCDGQYPIFLSQGGTFIDNSEDGQAVAAAKAALTFEDTLVTENRTLALPTSVEGFDGTITWTSGNTDIITDAGVVTIPADGIVYITMTATLTKGAVSDTKDFTITVKSTEVVTKELLDTAAAFVASSAALKPVYGTDSNINDYLESLLTAKGQSTEESGWNAIEVTVSEQGTRTYPATIEGVTAGIGTDGSISYLYIDPATLQSAITFASVSDAEFTLSLNGQTRTVKKNITLGWDIARVREYLNTALAAAVTVFDPYKGENGAIVIPNDVAAIEMPKTLTDYRFVNITWSPDSDTAVMAEEDPLKSTTTMTFVQPEEDTEITLAAFVNFTLEDGARVIVPTAVTFTKQGTNLDDIRAAMQAALNENYTTAKLNYSVSQQPIDPEHIHGDVQLLTGRNTGIADYSNYKFSVASDKESVIKINGYRANVYQPMPGEQAEEVTLTVTMEHREYDLSVTRELKVKVDPLTTEELDAAVALMEQVKAAYWTGINDNANEDADHVVSSLHAFQEADLNADSELYFIYNVKDRTNKGIIVGDMADYSTVGGQEAYNKFRSSKPGVIAHENLLLTKPQYDSAVTIDSVLEHAIYAKYAKTVTEGTWYDRYFSKLAGVPVSADLTVIGNEGPDPTIPREVTVTVRLTGVDMTGAVDTQVTVMSTQTIAEAIQAALGDEYNLSVSSSGYILSLTGPEDFNEANEEVDYWGQYLLVNGKYDCVGTLTQKVVDGSVYAIFSNEFATEGDSYWGFKYDVWFENSAYEAEVGETINPVIYQMAGDTAAVQAGVRVFCDGEEIGVSDTNGKVAISFDRPGTYLINTGDGNHIFSYAYVTVGSEEPIEPDPADYSAIDEALTKVPTDEELEAYTEESVKALKDAINAVDRTLTAEDQAVVDAMAEAIETALAGLTEKPAPVVPADYSKVDAALKKVPKDLSGYTKASADALKKAVAAVKRGLNYEDQAKVDKMAADIEAAIKGLKKDLNTMYRLYNPNSGEHFYTASAGEKNALIKYGWKDEGIAWYAPKTSRTPVYRLYNPNAGDHHYTTNAAEKNALVKLGWNYEGIGWYSCDEKEVTLYRLYNPNAKGAGAHHYTTNAGEKKALVNLGWKDEGIAWYGCKK